MFSNQKPCVFYGWRWWRWTCESEIDTDESYLDVSVYDVVVMAIAQGFKYLSHVVTENTHTHTDWAQMFSSGRPIVFDVNRKWLSPGNRLTVDEPGIGPLHDLKTQIRSIHTAHRHITVTHVCDTSLHNLKCIYTWQWCRNMEECQNTHAKWVNMRKNLWVFVRHKSKWSGLQFSNITTAQNNIEFNSVNSLIKPECRVF